MQDWTQDFFTGLALDTWQRSRSEAQTREEVAFLEQALKLRGPRRLLDIPCGDGRHAVALALAGHTVTGVDCAADNRERFAERAANAGVRPQFVRCDMRELSTGVTFEGAFCFGDSFGYFPRPESERFLHAVACALEPGARFALDTALAAESILPELARRSFQRIDDELIVLLECDYDVRDSRLDTTYTTLRDGRVVDVRTAHHYVFTSGEIVAMLDRAGLHTVELYADIDGAAYELGCERLLLVAERRS
jgi:SAM-dependent methyltransferase